MLELFLIFVIYFCSATIILGWILTLYSNICGDLFIRSWLYSIKILFIKKEYTLKYEPKIIRDKFENFQELHVYTTKKNEIRIGSPLMYNSLPKAINISMKIKDNRLLVYYSLEVGMTLFFCGILIFLITCGLIIDLPENRQDLIFLLSIILGLAAFITLIIKAAYKNAKKRMFKALDYLYIDIQD